MTRIAAAAFLELSDTVYRNGHGINIFTMTVIGRLSDGVHIHTLSRVFEEPGILVKSPSANVHFQNQLTLSYRDQCSSKSIKIFGNGTLQMTGLTSPIECDDVCARVVQWIVKYNASANANISLVDKYVAMINAKLQLNTPLDLIHVITRLRLMTDVICLYNPETYPGVNAKIQSRRVTMLVFRTGNVVISGGRSIADIAYAYDVIQSIVPKGDITKYTHRKMAERYHGYPISHLMTCSYQ
jgi:TATA-box binding protein (TBP) (component of TFIID and TFIIIB)